eukprot:514192-Prymnesium_polylepis.1
MGSPQRKAFGLVNNKIDHDKLCQSADGSPLVDPQYQRVGHVCLHVCKFAVSAGRRYRLTDGETGEFSTRTMLAV